MDVYKLTGIHLAECGNDMQSSLWNKNIVCRLEASKDFAWGLLEKKKDRGNERLREAGWFISESTGGEDTRKTTTGQLEVLF